MKKIKITWIERKNPLPPSAVSASGDYALNLVSLLLKRDKKILSSLNGGFLKDMVFFTGETNSLPWCDGVVYYGIDPDAPTLLLPTLLKPSVNSGFLEKAITIPDRSQYLVIPEKSLFLSTNGTLPLDREILTKWLEENKNGVA